MGMDERKMGAYLRGYYKPKEITIRYWATILGVNYTHMKTADFAYIPYPLPTEPKKKKSGRHITMQDIVRKQEILKSNLIQFCKDNNIEYITQIMDLFDKYSISAKKISHI